MWVGCVALRDEWSGFRSARELVLCDDLLRGGLVTHASRRDGGKRS